MEAKKRLITLAYHGAFAATTLLLVFVLAHKNNLVNFQWNDKPDLVISSAKHTGQLECGHYAIHRLLLLSGKPISIHEVEKALPPHGMGHSFSDLLSAFKTLNVNAKATKSDVSKLTLPALIHLQSPDHFSVIDRDGEGRLVLRDGPIDSWHVTQYDEVRSRASGYAITVDVQSKSQCNQLRLEVGSLIRDIGRQKAIQKTVRIEIPIHNSGKLPLVISKVDADCGCVKVEFPKEPILPGAKGQLVGSILLKANRGDSILSRRVRIVSSCERNPELDIFLIGRVDEKVEVAPDVLSLQAACPQEIREANVYLLFPGKIPDKIEIKAEGVELLEYKVKPVLQAMKEGLIVEYVNRIPGPGGHENAVAILKFRVPEKRGPFAGNLIIKTTHDGLPEHKLPVLGVSKPWIEAIPKSISFANLSKESELVVRLISSSSEKFGKQGSIAFEIKSIKCNASKLLIEKKILDHNNAIDLRVKKLSMKDSRFSVENIEIEVELADEAKTKEKLRIPVTFAPYSVDESKSSSPREK